MNTFPSLWKNKNVLIFNKEFTTKCYISEPALPQGSENLACEHMFESAVYTGSIISDRWQTGWQSLLDISTLSLIFDIIQ